MNAVILSPSGLNGIMTGHSYKMSDPGIDEILEEWKLFYPRRFALDPTPTLPSAIEVVLGGVRIRYPSQVCVCVGGGGGEEEGGEVKQVEYINCLIVRLKITSS